ncbi:MAG: AraC-like DNA-binding protein [Kiritimatiellia bacterium]|jgi:AraC-like DNA-binding protein
MQTDPLSDVLRVLRLSGGMFFRVNLSAPFGISAMGAETMLDTFAPGAAHILPFHLVTQGPIWIDVPGNDSVLLEKGDIIVMPHGASHSLCDVSGTEPVPVISLKDQVSGFPPTLTSGGDGPESRALCGFFHCNGRLFNPLMESLPEVVVIRQDPDRTPWLAATMERAFSETMASRPGGDALIERLTGLLFLEVVQRYLEQNHTSGWLAGLSDPIVSKALGLLHARPERDWTVESLARRVGSSRSVLSERFSATVGKSPIKYLTAWRMELAAIRLLDTDDAIIDIAEDTGYESEASFGRAFKRHSGRPPGTWRKQQKESRPTHQGMDVTSFAAVFSGAPAQGH